MPQFDVGFYASQLFWLVVVFSFLYFLVSKFIAPRAESILTARNRCFEENIRYADEYNEKAKYLHEFRAEALEEMDFKVEEMQKQAMSVLDKSFEDKQKKIEKEISKNKESAEKEIAEYVKKFRSEVATSSVDLTSFIIKKITQKSVDLEILQKIQGKK